MAKRFEANEDWIKREGGRIPSKGAAAAERASAGLGCISDDEALLALGLVVPPAREEPAEELAGQSGSA
jgi:hypothetical protein